MQACRTWDESRSQSAAAASPTVYAAAGQAEAAERLDGRWGQLAQDLTYLASLPETNDTPTQIHQAQVDEQQANQTYAGLGVPVSG